jgi:hypothetical protein
MAASAATAQDAIIMNLDDLLCVGATDNILLVTLVPYLPSYSLEISESIDSE